MNAKEMASLAVHVYGAMQKPEEFEQLLDLVLKSPHETILEIGSGHGGTLWAWSHLPHNKTVISVDLPGGDFGGGLTDHDKEVIENWMDPSKNTFLCAADSHHIDTYVQVAETLEEHGDGLVDVLFIDGDHTYEGVKKDFERYSLLVRRGGLIAFHDICDHSTTAPTCKVKDFWDQMKEGIVIADKIEIVSEPKTWGGIGVLKLFPNCYLKSVRKEGE